MIVGVDPGTTVGWACLSLRGKVLFVGSKRNFDQDSLLSNIMGFGRAIVVGCDKAKTPFLAHSIAAKFGAKIVSPKYDLLIDEKRELTKDFATNDAHEFDALASAIFAYKKILPLIRRVDKVLEKENKTHLFEKVVEIVLKEGMSIRAALVLCDHNPVQIEIEKIKEEERDVDLIRLFSSLSRERRSFIQVKEQNTRLENDLRKLKNEIELLRARQSELVRPKSKELRLSEKDSRIQSFADKFEHARKELELAKKNISFLERVLLKKGIVAIPRMDKLSWQESVKVKTFVDDSVFIESVDSLSDNAVKVLSETGVRIVLCSKLPSEKLRKDLPFVFREQDGTKIGNIFLVNVSVLEKIRKERDALLKVIDDFKKERSKV